MAGNGQDPRGREDHDQSRGKLQVPTIRSSPFIEGDGTGPDIWRASVRVLDAAVAEGLQGKPQDRLDRGRTPARRRKQTCSTAGCPTRPSTPFREYLVGIKGPLDHAGRRRHPLAQRRAAPDARPLRVPAPGALVQRRAVAGEAPEKVDMVIFRENTEDIYAGIEWAAEYAEAKKVIDFLEKEMRRQEDPLPGNVGHRHQAGVARGHRAADPRGHRSYAIEQQAQERDAGAQGQHHEVHRGRVPRLGLRAGQARVRRTVAVAWDDCGGKPPARRRCWSRTRSPTSRCSRC